MTIFFYKIVYVVKVTRYKEILFASNKVFAIEGPTLDSSALKPYDQNEKFVEISIPHLT